MDAPMRGRSEVLQCKRSDSRYTWEREGSVKLNTFILCPKTLLYAKSVNLRDLLQVRDEFFHFVLTRDSIGRPQYR